MKDYSNYYISSKNNIKNSGRLLFQLQQQNGFEGFDVLVNEMPSKVIIQQHSNPLNENKEDRKLLCLEEVNVNRGSIVKIENENWLVISDVDFNGVYKTCKIQKSNHILKFYNSQNEFKEVPVIISNQLLYTPGISESKLMSIPDGKMNIILSKNEDTKVLCRDMRFIFNNKYAFKVTYVDELTLPGLLTMVLKEDDPLPTDDKENNIADNSHLNTTTNQLLKTTIINKDNTPLW